MGNGLEGREPVGNVSGRGQKWVVAAGKKKRVDVLIWVP